VVQNQSGQGGVDFTAMESSITVADDLSPSVTVQMDKKKILAFVTVHGSANSHTTILAHMMSIPALIGVKMDLGAVQTGMTAIVDGAAGEIIFEPTEFQCSEAEKKIKKINKHRSEYYRYYTCREWNDYRNYELCLDSSKLGFEKSAEFIKAYLEIKFGSDITAESGRRRCIKRLEFIETENTRVKAERADEKRNSYRIGFWRAV